LLLHPFVPEPSIPGTTLEQVGRDLKADYRAVIEFYQGCAGASVALFENYSVSALHLA
jgi:hypothetical protein